MSTEFCRAPLHSMTLMPARFAQKYPERSRRLLAPALAVSVNVLTVFGAGVHADSPQTQRIAVGGSITITLNANPSTGYSWAVDPAASTNLEIVRIELIPDIPAPSKNLDRLVVGAPVLREWKITGLEEGTAKIVIIYRRAWERAEPARTETFEIVVSK